MQDVSLCPNGPPPAIGSRPTVVAAILDKSGSMDSLRDEVISGFNKFLADQKTMPGVARIHVTLFDTSVVHHERGADVRVAKPLDRASYEPSGMTALLDAVGSTLNALRYQHGKEDDVIVLIITDGQENSSHRFSRREVRSLINAARADGWEFVFMGADDSAWSEAGAMGIPASCVSTYSHDEQGVASAYSAMAARVTAKRASR